MKHRGRGKPAFALLLRLPFLVTLVFLWSVMFCASATAAPRVYVVVSDESPHYIDVSRAVTQYLKRHYPHSEPSTHVAGVEPLPDVTGSSMVVSIGTLATELAVESYPDIPQLGLFITDIAWKEIESRHPGLPNKAAITIDQPMERHLLLARALVPEARVFSTLLGPASSQRRKELLAAAAAYNMELVYDTVSLDSNPLRALYPLFEQGDVFIAIPDQGLLNRSIAQWALHLGFKKKIPVIGFSASYSDAGAAVSIYSAPEDIARQGAEWLTGYFSGQTADIWRQYPPAYFTLTVNRSVARSLELPLDDDEIRERMMKLSGRSIAE